MDSDLILSLQNEGYDESQAEALELRLSYTISALNNLKTNLNNKHFMLNNSQLTEVDINNQPLMEWGNLIKNLKYVDDMKFIKEKPLLWTIEDCSGSSNTETGFVLQYRGASGVNPRASITKDLPENATSTPTIVMDAISTVGTTTFEGRLYFYDEYDEQLGGVGYVGTFYSTSSKQEFYLNNWGVSIPAGAKKYKIVISIKNVGLASTMTASNIRTVFY